MDVKFPIGSSVVVECRHTRPSYKLKFVELITVETGLFYRVVPDVPNEETLWVAERRLTLAPIYDDGMESWDLC